MKKYGKFLVMIGVSTVIMFCMMCVASVFTRETQLSEAENEQEADMYAVCETRY